MACYDYDAGRTFTTLRALGAGLFEANHTIGNVTKSDAGTYKIKNLGLAILIDSQPLYNCSLHVFAALILILHNCVDVVEERSEVECLCKKKVDVSEEFKLNWFDHRGNVQNKRMSLAFFFSYQKRFRLQMSRLEIRRR